MRTLAFLLALSAVACGPEFDPPSEVRGVRVMAVQKHSVGGTSEDAWTTAEGSPIEMTLLAHDGRPSRDQDVNLMWFAGCANPPGDLYYGCFPLLAIYGLLLDQCGEELGPLPWSIDLDPSAPELAVIAQCAPEVIGFAQDLVRLGELGTAASAAAPKLQIGGGSSFVYDVPEQIVLSRPGVDDYGLSYVFFSACAGRVGLVDEYRAAFKTGQMPDEGLLYPLGCFDDADRMRGTAHFVSGYSSVYTYADEALNANTNCPIGGALINGSTQPSDPQCEGADCVSASKVCVGLQCVPDAVCADDCPLENPSFPGAAGGALRCSDFAACVPACSEKDPENCPQYGFRPLLERGAVLDGVGASEEQLWIRYYTSAGSITRDPVRLYDSEAGWNTEYGTKFHAPGKPGPFFLWAAVHDSRGGVNWVRTSVLAE